MDFGDIREVAEIEEEHEEQRHEHESEESEGDGAEDVAAPKRKRGKDRDWKQVECFSNKDLYEASEIHTKITSQMHLRSTYKTQDNTNVLYACSYFRKRGWKPCQRALRVSFSQTSMDILVLETDDAHVHEKDPDFGTNTYYRWTEAQEGLIRLYLKTKTKSNKVILRDLRDQNLVNGQGKLPTAAQVKVPSFVLS